MLIGSLDAGRNVIERAADRDEAVGKGREVLGYFGKAALDHLGALHALEEGKVIFDSMEGGVVRLKRVVYLE